MTSDHLSVSLPYLPTEDFGLRASSISAGGGEVTFCSGRGRRR